jgi:hypothetical protein
MGCDTAAAAMIPPPGLVPPRGLASEVIRPVGDARDEVGSAADCAAREPGRDRAPCPAALARAEVLRVWLRAGSAAGLRESERLVELEGNGRDEALVEIGGRDVICPVSVTAPGSFGSLTFPAEGRLLPPSPSMVPPRRALCLTPDQLNHAEIARFRRAVRPPSPRKMFRGLLWRSFLRLHALSGRKHILVRFPFAGRPSRKRFG